MRFDYFQQIMHRVQQDIVCPRCGCHQDFQAPALDIFSVQKNGIEFRTQCPECGANIGIAAQVTAHSGMPELSSFPRTVRRSETLRPDIGGIQEELKNFQGKDIRELFNGNSNPKE